jgi:hypothetical protein
MARPSSLRLTRRVSPAWATLTAVYLAFTATFASYSVNNDGQVYLDFMRRLTGEPGPSPPTHQFGSAVFALPFFLVARLLSALGLHDLGGAGLEQVSMVVATTVALLLIVYLGSLLLERLGLPATPGVLALTVIGTPLFYYAVFAPTYKHVIDTLYIMGAVLLLLRALDRPSVLAYAGLGACIGLSIVTRTANVALVPGLFLPLALRRNAHSIVVALGAAVAVVVLLFAVGKVEPNPAALPLPQLTIARSSNVAAAGLVVGHNFYLCRNRSANLTFKQCMHDVFGVWPDLSAPFKMLFSLHRGLFLWTPLTAFGVVGFALLLARLREQRAFLLGLSVAALCLWFVHFLWGDFWDGGFAFSQRFLSGLFPIFLLGAAELVRRRRAAALAALSLCAAFSLVLAFTFETGFKGISRKTGVDRMVRLYISGERTPQQLVRKVGVQARGRWLGH